MRSDSDLRQRILEKSLELFRNRGVRATTIKLIASAAGCTNAALYYYFEGGKDEILEEVLREVLSRKIRAFEELDTALPYSKFVEQITAMASRDFEVMTNNVSWLVVEYPWLPEPLQRMLHEHLIRGHEILVEALSRYIPDLAVASSVAWTLFCALFGYHQVFRKLGLSERTDFDPSSLVEILVMHSPGP